jgi:hypothetical protein
VRWDYPFGRGKRLRAAGIKCEEAMILRDQFREERHSFPPISVCF